MSFTITFNVDHFISSRDFVSNRVFLMKLFIQSLKIVRQWKIKFDIYPPFKERENFFPATMELWISYKKEWLLGKLNNEIFVTCTFYYFILNALLIVYWSFDSIILKKCTFSRKAYNDRSFFFRKFEKRCNFNVHNLKNSKLFVIGIYHLFSCIYDCLVLFQKLMDL